MSTRLIIDLQVEQRANSRRLEILDLLARSKRITSNNSIKSEYYCIFVYDPIPKGKFASYDCDSRRNLTFDNNKDIIKCQTGKIILFPDLTNDDLEKLIVAACNCSSSQNKQITYKSCFISSFVNENSIDKIKKELDITDYDIYKLDGLLDTEFIYRIGAPEFFGVIAGNNSEQGAMIISDLIWKVKI